jgi:integrase
MPLTDTAIRAAKPEHKPFKLSDFSGLCLVVTPAGSKLWRYDYALHGKRNTYSIGKYPDVSLAQARQERDRVKALVKQGVHPTHEKRLAKVTRAQCAQNTFEALAEEYLARKRVEGLAERTLIRNSYCVRHLLPFLGKKPIASITPSELLLALQSIEKRQAFETAAKARSIAGAIFRYAIVTQRADRDPSADLKGALITRPARHYAALLDPVRIGALLRDIEAYEGHLVTKTALQLLPHVFLRPGELRAAAWSEIRGPLWELPAQKMKRPRPHIVPLSRQARALIDSLMPLTGHGVYLFPSLQSAKRCMSENTLNAALRRLGYSKEEMTSHGFRSIASTLLHESGLFSENAIERQLAHVERNQVKRAYNRAEYLEERTRMMQWWSDRRHHLRHNAADLAIALQGAPNA